jgi:hypothetical protein
MATAKQAHPRPTALHPGWPGVLPPAGTVRTCAPYRGELARHRLVSADGHDYVVATVQTATRTSTYVTGAYPVSRGYLVMIRQPLYEIRSTSLEAAHQQHEQLVEVLAEAGVGVVRARRALAARQRAERSEAQRMRGSERAAVPAAKPIEAAGTL